MSDQITTTITAPTQRQFPCKQCGANLVFAPGTDSLQCPYCGTLNEVPKSPDTIQELDFLKYLHGLPEGDGASQEQIVIKCTCCAAETTLPPNTTSGVCAFCGSAIVATGSSKKAIRPQGVLPFKIKQNEAAELFRDWVNSRWFAPTRLKLDAERAAIRGAYVPAWTYDADAETDYTGERGEHYWVTETYTERDANGNTVTRTRQVQRTRWWPAAGHVANQFDDILVMATRTLPPKQLDRLEPWDLPALVPYGDEYLSGFVAESYQINLPEGFDRAKQIMAPVIHQTICRHIGGDEQRVHSVNTQYDDITFKHLLLPVWISAYTFGEKIYRFLVNARTGEVQGERPYSWAKITLLVVAIIVLIVSIVMLARGG
jgi:DNA-directed RNA polymerase subunit RPC12/RpoP